MSPRSKVVVGVVVAGLGAAGLIAILLWAIDRNTSRGVPVGRVDLKTPGAALLVDLAAGDALHFRIDALFVTPPGSNRERKSELDLRLRSSTLTVQVADAGGATRETSCAAYFGAGHQGDVAATTIEKSMVTECTLLAVTPGRHTVRPSVAWDGSLVVQLASVEVRVERPAR